MMHRLFGVPALCLAISLALLLPACKTGKTAGKSAAPPASANATAKSGKKPPVTVPTRTSGTPRAKTAAPAATSPAATANQPAQSAQAAQAAPPKATASAKPPSKEPSPAAARPAAAPSSLARPVEILPPPAWGKTRPAVIFLHDAGTTPRKNAEDLGLVAAARDAKVLLALPQGTGPADALSWNAGSCCGEAQARNVDDVASLGDLLRSLVATHHVDPRRIYLAGQGAGGMLAYRFACVHADLLAGVAAVGASLEEAACKPGRALPVLHAHSLEDLRWPYFGGPASDPLRLEVRQTPGAPATTGLWARMNGCQGPPVLFTQGAATWERHGGCAGGNATTLLTLSSHAGKGGNPYGDYPVGFKILEYFQLTKKWDEKAPLPVDIPESNL